MKNKIIYFIAITVLFVNYQTLLVSAYDDQTTHPALTDEIVDFYNLSFPDKQLTPEQKEWIIEGSILEDTPPRWINHFYDPITRTGWSGEHTGKYDAETVQLVSKNLIAPYGIMPISSLEWLHNEQSQARYGFYKGAKTWERGILEMIKGNEKEAYQILGYILHLIEDASVPDHTRNDTHAHELEGVTGDYGSPYEEYSKNYTRKNLNIVSGFYQQGLRPITKSTIDEYLISLAEYSNKYFFSKDTINDPKYQNPKIIKDDGNFGYGVDENGKEFPLARVVNTKTEKIFLLDKNDTKVIDAYFSRLSRQAVLHGAGVINLFNEKVKTEKEYPQHAVVYDFSIINYFTIPRFSFAGTATGLWTTASNFTDSVFAAVGEVFGGIFGSINDEKLAETIDVKSLRENNDLSESSNSKNTGDDVKQKSDKLLAQAINGHTVIKQENGQKNSQQTRKTVDEEKETEQKVIESKQQKPQVEKDAQQEQVKQEQAIPKTQPTPPVVSKVEPSFKECSFNTTKSPTREKVVINEVAWMGGSSDFGLTSTDEWIELKNISSSEIDISNWQLIDKAEQVKINLGLVKNTKIKAGQFILLERTDDDSAPNIAADLIYSNTLNNSDEWLRLFDNQCNLVDEAMANPNWPAGDNVQKRTMERDGSTSLTTSFSWHTYSGIAENNIFGTPKKENSAPAVVYGGGGGSGWGASYGSGGSVSVSTGNEQQTTTSTPASTSKILISEVQITGGASKTENDFIELYNPNSSQVNLNGYRLVKRIKAGLNDTSIKSWTSDTYISANGYYLWANNGYTDIPATPDVTTLATISNDNSVAIRYGALDAGAIIDSVAWGGAENIFIEGLVFTTNSIANQSLQRKFQNNTFIDTDNNASDFEIQTCPSPKAQSRSCPIVDQTPSVLLPLSIAEIIYDLEGSDEGKELVRLSNPNSEKVKINDYSLQYLGSDGDFAKIKKKNFVDGNEIPAQGIFKIGMNCSTNTPCENVDMSWSESLNNSLGTVFLVSNKELLTGLSDADIIDGFHYPEATQLVQPSDFTANYDQNKLEINLSWNTNLSLVYQIQEYNSLGVTIFEGKGSSFSKRIDEVGKNYKFSIKAFNENAEYTQLIEKETDVPSFLKDVHFYKNPNLANNYGDYLIEASYASYPFVADLYDRPDSWKLLVFYLNSEASDKKEEFMPLRNRWEPVNKENVLRLIYQRCSNSWQESNSLILPDASSRCHTWDSLSSSSLNLNLLEDPYFKIGAINPTNNAFSPNDYMTVAYYSFYESGGGEQIFKLVATDDTKYYFQNTAPIHSSPTTPSNLEILSYTVNSPTSTVQFSFNSSIDSDSIDSIIQYEWSLDGVLWQPLNLTSRISDKISADIFLELGGTYNVFIRAIDDLGNLSGVAETTIILPSPLINLNPDPSNDYFAIDDVKLVGDVINIKWRLIKNPAPNGTFGIIPFNPLIEISSNNISNLQALHRDYDSNFNYPYITANSSNMCNNAITSISQYVLGWQYQTNFSSISGITSPGLLGKEINFGLYIGTPCNPSDNEDNPIFSDYPIFVKN